MHQGQTIFQDDLEKLERKIFLRHKLEEIDDEIEKKYREIDKLGRQADSYDDLLQRLGV